MPNVTVHHGDSRDVLKTIPDNSVDSVVTDPPYALVSIGKRFGKPGAAPAKGDVYARASSGFMGQQWDTGEVAFDPAFWAEVLRVLKPGGHVAAFGGTRTYGRLQVAIEDGGFEVRDSVIELVATDTRALAFLNSLNDEQRQAFVRMLDEREGGLLGWLYGSGFPKSHDVAKGIDKRLGVARAKVRVDAASLKNPPNMVGGVHTGEGDRLWRSEAMARGYHEADSAEAATEQAQAWTGWGTAIKPAIEPIVLARKPLEGTVAANVMKWGTGGLNIDGCRVEAAAGDEPAGWSSPRGGIWKTDADAIGKLQRNDLGRWPANVVHDGSPEVIAAFPESDGGGSISNRASPKTSGIYGAFPGEPERWAGYDDSGSAARFFYSAKADSLARLGGKHPTVKPTDLMRWLITLITPPGGVVLDPFAGSGSTAIGAIAAGFDSVMIERVAEYAQHIRERVAWAQGQGALTSGLTARNKPKAALSGLLGLMGGD